VEELMQRSAEAGVQIGEQRSHLFVGKATGKGWHHAPTGEHDALDVRVGGWHSAGQIRVIEDVMQVGWGFLERQVIEFVTMSAAHIVEMLPYRLLRCE
jgi:hypothetical protein